MIKGIPVSDGIAIGNVVVIKEIEINVDRVTIVNSKEEVARFRSALKKAEIQLQCLRTKAEKKLGIDKAEIFDTHLLILNDPEFIDSVIQQINKETVNSEYAVTETIKTYVAKLEGIEDEYISGRATDIGDVGKRILCVLVGKENTVISEIDSECIIIARDLTPSDTVQLNKKVILGFVTEIGGKTSHTAIMARSLEIPAVVGFNNITKTAKNGDIVIVNGSSGEVILNPNEETLKKYKKKQSFENQNKEKLLKYVNAKTITLDGKEVEVSANIGSPVDIENVLKYGADGVGLFRSEFLYMNSSSLPTEEEQFESYSQVAKKMENKPVIIRTLDVGGDKDLPYLDIGTEMNPFLGYRAIRVCLVRQDIFKSQLRAILRASAFGNLRIMFPMISGLEELLSAKLILEEVKADLLEKHISFNKDIEIGIMIEIPSAAIMSDVLAKEVDFFSIGTNDLVQYTIAVDRLNDKIANLYDPYNPAVLRLIKLVIANGHKEGKKVCMCGEAAADLKLIPVLLGFGLDEFSMSPSSILHSRQIISSINYSEAKNLSEKVLSFTKIEEIKAFLESSSKILIKTKE